MKPLPMKPTPSRLFVMIDSRFFRKFMSRSYRTYKTYRSYLSFQPHLNAARDQVGGVLLDEVAGLRDSHQRQIAFEPFPGVVERAGQQRRVAKAVDHKH